MGKTLLNPKKDSKWERGRTRHVLHFGAHVRGGKAVGAEVEGIPSCLLEVLQLIETKGLLEASSKGDDQAETIKPDERVTAATVDFFRKGSYSPALAATAPLWNPSSSASPGPAQPVHARADAPDESSRHFAVGEHDSDTEATVCMLWLQAGGEVVVGNAQQLAKCSKGAQGAGTKGAQASPAGRVVRAGPESAGVSEAEGLFSGMERVSAPRGAVMTWNSTEAQGLQVAVPNAPRDSVLVSFQTLTPEASSRVVMNRRQREDARAKAAAIRRAALEAKEAKAKGPIPGTPIVVADWRQEQGDGDGYDERPPSETLGGSGVGGTSTTNTNSSGSGSESGRDNEEGSEEDVKTPSLEKEHVHAVYDTIAPHWSHTRYKPWPKVEKFLSELAACSLVADAGCGNGKYLGCEAAGGFLIGSDTSVNLLRVCKERLPKAEVLASDCMRLPYRSGLFDAAISIAVLHHFSSEARRLRALTELRRLLKPRGRMLVYAWAIEQEQDSRRSFAAQDVLVPWHLADHHNQSQDQHQRKSRNDATDRTVVDDDDGSNVHSEDSGGRTNDPDKHAANQSFLNDEAPAGQPKAGDGGRGTEPIAPTSTAGGRPGSTESRADGTAGGCTAGVATTDNRCVSAPTPNAPRHGVRVDGLAGSAGSVVYQRYCHVYAEGELEGLVERVDGLRLVESYYDRSNWCVVAERED
ncbi:unnamed protein product [Scytosiphon promiscuus]